MARPLLPVGLLLLALAQPVAPAHAQQPPDLFHLAALGAPAPDQLAELERERVLVEEGTSSSNGDRGTVSALVLFERPRADVLRLLASTVRQKEYRPELSRLEVIEASERGDVVEYRVSFMLTTLRYRARHGWSYEDGRVWWTLDPRFENDMQVLDGLWELRALDERRTLGRFATRIHIGPALPAFLQDFATRKKLPESMDQVRRWVDSGREMEAVIAATNRSFVRRSVGAALLDANIYEEVEADRRANAQAASVVALSAAAAGIGSLANHGTSGVLWYTAAALISWYVWAAIAYWIGTRLLPGPHTSADVGELLRTIGFSSAPGVLRLFALFPPIAGLVFLASTLWMLVAMVVAVRQALDYQSTGRAVAVCAIGFPFYAVTLALSLFLLGPWPI